MGAIIGIVQWRLRSNLREAQGLFSRLKPESSSRLGFELSVLTYSRAVKILTTVPGLGFRVDQMIPAAERTIFTIVFCCLPIVKVRCTIPCRFQTAEKLVREFPPEVRHSQNPEVGL